MKVESVKKHNLFGWKSIVAGGVGGEKKEKDRTYGRHMSLQHRKIYAFWGCCTASRWLMALWASPAIENCHLLKALTQLEASQNTSEYIKKEINPWSIESNIQPVNGYTAVFDQHVWDQWKIVLWVLTARRPCAPQTDSTLGPYIYNIQQHNNTNTVTYNNPIWQLNNLWTQKLAESSLDTSLTQSVTKIAHNNLHKGSIYWKGCFIALPSYCTVVFVFGTPLCGGNSVYSLQVSLQI